MRQSSEVDLALNMLPLLARMADAAGARAIVSTIIDRFFKERDQSRFGLMNAVTSVARDARDPEARWRLEEFGGAIGAGVVKPAAGPQPARRKILVRA